MGTKIKTIAARAISNVDLWNEIRAMSPTFASHTAKGTAELFTERGFEQVKSNDQLAGTKVLNDFFELSMRVWLNIINISHAQDRLAESGFGEYYDQPWGGVIQRMAIPSIKPVTPAYKNLEDGKSVDMQIVRKPKATERFYLQNFDYQSFITIPDSFTYKQIFISEYGMSEFMAGIMEGLRNGYVIQVYENKLACLNAAINDNELQNSQVYKVDYTPDAPTQEQLTGLTLAIMNIMTAMTIHTQTSAFNAAKFSSTQDKSRLKLLIRAGYKNAMAVNVLLGAFNPENLNLGIDVIEVPNFGGLKPYQSVTDNQGTTELFPVYSETGEQIGWNTEASQSEATVNLGEEKYVDPNADVIAVLADKGAVFECRQNPYTVEVAPHNARGLYTNYWASSPNNTIAYDKNYNLVVIKKNT